MKGIVRHGRLIALPALLPGARAGLFTSGRHTKVVVGLVAVSASQSRGVYRWSGALPSSVGLSLCYLMDIVLSFYMSRFDTATLFLNRGLLLEHPRGSVPLSTPLAPSGGVRIVTLDLFIFELKFIPGGYFFHMYVCASK